MIQKTNTLLDVQNVNITLGGKQILRDINFKIRDITRTDFIQGQVVSLIGKSGIGKSTLFNILAGLLQPDAGSKILVNAEQTVSNVGDMGVVFQDYYIDYWRTVRTLLTKATKKNPNIHEKDRKDVINQIATEFNLLEHLDKFPGQLSGGQKQRVSIAEQLMIGTNFLLLDEPFSGLDVFMIDKVVDTLVKVSLSDELKTLVIVSHNLADSIAISDTVFVMNVEPEKPGATIVKEIDLIERDLAYHKDIKYTPQFIETLKEVKNYMA
jgi:ABC-type nitrate/sulfonate/bicarbonate transport system ATPase subunit